MMQTIEVLISPIGETVVQTRGYTGTDCLQASKWLERALGQVTAEEKTPEYYQSPTTQQQVQQ
ncbi:MAG: DUF2997 domain-containing protein [Planctomycetia bacterium]|nr:DUF2997 domain-containing protein [Planctomycetia bacterium]